MARIVFTCWKHGDLYEVPKARLTDPANVDAVRPLRPDVPKPTGTDTYACPFCGAALVTTITGA